MGYEEIENEVEHVLRRWHRVSIFLPNSVVKNYIVTDIDWAKEKQQRRKQAQERFEEAHDRLNGAFERISLECRDILSDGITEENEVDGLVNALSDAFEHFQWSETINSDYLTTAERRELDSLQWKLESYTQIAKQTMRFAWGRRAQVERAKDLRERIKSQRDELEVQTKTDSIEYSLAALERIRSTLKQIESDIDGYQELISGHLPPETPEFQELVTNLDNGQMLHDVEVHDPPSVSTIREQCHQLDRDVRRAQTTLHIARADVALTDAIEATSNAYREIKKVSSDREAIENALAYVRSELDDARSIVPSDDPLLHRIDELLTGHKRLELRLESTEQFSQKLSKCDNVLSKVREQYGTYCDEQGTANEYLRKSTIESLEIDIETASDYAEAAFSEISTINNAPSSYKDAIEIREDEIADLTEKLTNHNSEFTETLTDRYPEVFIDEEGHTLNQRQGEAVIADEARVLVSAPAGTGKTKTINHRLKYLINVKGTPAERILPTGFATATVAELEERIEFAGVQPQTLDKIALNVTRSAHPSFQIPDSGDDSPAEYIAKELFEEKLTEDSEFYDEEFARDLIRLKRHWQTPRNRKPPDEIDDSTRASNSFGRIEHYLEQHGFNPVRDRPIHEVEETYGQGEYVADIFLPEFNLVISHLPLPDNPFGNVQSEVDPLVALRELVNSDDVEGGSDDTTISDIHTRVKWEKQRFEELEEYDIVYTYEWETQAGVLERHLEQRLLQRFIIPIPITEDAYLETHSNHIVSEIQEDIKEELGKAIAMARTRGVPTKKSNAGDKSPDQIAVADGGVGAAKTITELYPDENPLYSAFADVLSSLYEDYEEWLDNRKHLDFIETKIRGAKSLLQDDADEMLLNQYNYDYIIVDEFQDISPSDMLFLETLVEANEAQLYCVGDDWQSIYSFRGTTPMFFLEFESYFDAETNVITLNRTYRNPQAVVDASTRLISNNANQRDKDLTAHFDTEGSITIHKGSSRRMVQRTADLVEEYCHQTNDGTIELNSDASIMVIAKLNNQTYEIRNELHKRGIPAQVKQSNQEAVADDRVVITTAHRSKGDSARHVIVHKAVDDKFGGFPDTRDGSLQSPLEPVESNTFDSERRLFYVALTRTERTVDIVTTSNQSDQSRFIREFRPDFQKLQQDQTKPKLSRAELDRLRTHGIWDSDHKVLSETPLDGSEAQEMLQRAYAETETGIALFQYYVEILASQRGVAESSPSEDAVEFFDWYISEADEYFTTTYKEPPSATIKNALAPFTSRIERYNRAIEDGFKQLFEEQQVKTVIKLIDTLDECSLLDIPSKPERFDEVIRMYVDGLALHEESMSTLLDSIEMANTTPGTNTDFVNTDIADAIDRCVEYLRTIESNANAFQIPYPLPSAATVRWLLPELEKVGAILLSDQVLSDIRTLKRLAREPHFDTVVAATDST